MEWTDYPVIVVLQAVVTVIIWFCASYVKEKGKNLATREDIEEMTRRVEAVKSEHAKELAEIRSDLTKALKSQEMVGYSELEYRKQQLEEFYGPIYAYLKSNETIFHLWNGQKLTEINLDVIRVLQSQNEAIASILINKAHLVDGDSFPEHFRRFATSTTIWNSYCSRPEDPNIPQHVAVLPEARFPSEFQDYIYSKTEDLKKRLNELHEKYQIS